MTVPARRGTRLCVTEGGIGRGVKSGVDCRRCVLYLISVLRMCRMQPSGHPLSSLPDAALPEPNPSTRLRLARLGLISCQPFFLFTRRACCICSSSFDLIPSLHTLAEGYEVFLRCMHRVYTVSFWRCIFNVGRLSAVTVEICFKEETVMIINTYFLDTVLDLLRSLIGTFVVGYGARTIKLTGTCKKLKIYSKSRQNQTSPRN